LGAGSMPIGALEEEEEEEEESKEEEGGGGFIRQEDCRLGHGVSVECLFSYFFAATFEPGAPNKEQQTSMRPSDQSARKLYSSAAAAPLCLPVEDMTCHLKSFAGLSRRRSSSSSY